MIVTRETSSSLNLTKFQSITFSRFSSISKVTLTRKNIGFGSGFGLILDYPTFGQGLEASQEL